MNANGSFIRNNFREDELMHMEIFFKDSVKKSSTLNMKVFWTIFGAGWAVAIFIVLLILIMTGVIYIPF